jgi:hypothetical protein
MSVGGAIFMEIGDAIFIMLKKYTICVKRTIYDNSVIGISMVRLLQAATSIRQLLYALVYEAPHVRHGCCILQYQQIWWVIPPKFTFIVISRFFLAKNVCRTAMFMLQLKSWLQYPPKFTFMVVGKRFLQRISARQLWLCWSLCHDIKSLLVLFITSIAFLWVVILL